MITSLLNGGFYLLCNLWNYICPKLYLAYADYLELMFEASDDLVEVDIDTVPDGVPVSLSWLEWADLWVIVPHVDKLTP